MGDQAEWILDRIGPTRDEVVINKCSLTCGRMRDQDIVCLSLLVSREHCEFALLQDGLSVIDFGSSNGVFVNGQQIRARQRNMLKENDYVGIGCCNIEDLDNSMFVYQVKRRVISNDRFNRKQQSRNRQVPVPVPNKMQKISSAEDDDIEIIEPINNDSAVIQNKKINPLAKQATKEFQKISNSVKQVNHNVHLKPVVGECSSTSNIDNEVGGSSKNPAKITEKVNASERIESNNFKNNTSNKVPEIIEIDIEEPVITNIKTEPMQLDEVGTSSANISNQEVRTNSASIPKPEVQNTQVENCSPFVDDNAEVGTTNSSHMKLESINEDVESHSSSINDCNEEMNDENDCNEEMNAENNEVSNVKEEFYSQIDLVDIGDEDDDLFPSSQLFNKSSIKEEIEENDDNEQMHSSQFLDEEDDHVITIIDSDEEDNDELNYLDPLRQIKAEPAPDSEVAEMIVPEILETDFNMAVDNLPPNNNDIVSSSTRVEIDNSASSLTKESEESARDKKLPNNEEIDSSASIQSTGAFDEALQSSVPSTSKNVTLSPSAKPIKKGVKIIEPHHIKPKKRGRPDEGKRRSSDSKFSSSRKDKKSKKHKSSSISSKKSSHHSSSSSSRSKAKSSSRSHKTSSESKEKQESDKTNESINQSASISKKPEEPEKPKNRTTIVKAKVSSKSRGDMLCESMINLRPTPRTINKKPSSEPAKSAPSKDLQKTAPVINPTCIIPRRQVPSGSIRSTTISSHSEVQNSDSSINNVLESLSGLNSVSSSISHKENTSTVLKNTTNLLNLPSSSTSNNVRISPSDTDSIANDLDFPADSGTLKPSLTISMQSGNSKRVSFKENIASVKEFPIDPGNSMRNIKEGSVKELPKPLELQIEDFLARVFAWEPCWMEQQQKVKELPPIVDKKKLIPLPNTFNRFEQYYKKMEVLLLLETWQLLLKEYECTGSKYSNSRTVCCAIERDSIKQQVTSNRLRYSKLDIKTIVTRDELRLKSNPVFGDMIILEYTIKLNGQVKWRRAFAYVMEVRQQNSLRSLPSTHPLFKRVSNPHAIITYTVQTRVIDEHTVQFEQLARLRSILYLRPHLRAIKGLQCVSRSALRDSILHVDIQEYNLEQPIPASGYPLITNDKLNEKQKEAVIKFTDAATNMKSKIGLLVGPPGTGKSTVITNLVTQMLYGDGRFINGNAKRILVCAPSNAAIDEIVLRLLEIRQAISQREHRFRMVRIGREECMHEEVRKISVADLARKEANRQYTGNRQKNLEENERKKQLLLKTIKSLNDLMASDPHNRARYEIDVEHTRSKYEKLSHRSPEAEQMERNKMETSAKLTILHGAHVIACTLSSCFNGQMESVFGGNANHIATCIVDEATQCCEAETLIPLMLGVKSLILVGDPNQLPATVMSTDAKKLGLDRSLFTRAKEALESQLEHIPDKSKDPVIMLKEQYRMVSAISYWPNKYFYKGRLIDRVAYNKSFPYQPYRILNVDGDQDQTKFSNTSEALFVGNLVHALMMCDRIATNKTKISIGIITPYQNQRTKILETIRDQTRSVPLEIKNKFETECNTIDSFQGQERDVIIMSCVRSHGIGFLSDPQRLCVALTRAKNSLIICGNLAPFKRDKMWDDLLCDARSRGLIVNLNKNARPDEIKRHVVRLDTMR